MIPPQLAAMFGGDPLPFVLGFVDATRDFIIQLCERMSARTGITTSTKMLRGRRVDLRMIPSDDDSTAAVALILCLWATRVPDILEDEANRLLQNMPVGFEGRCDCTKAIDNPYIDKVAGLTGIELGVVAIGAGLILAGIAAVVGIAFLVLPGLMELAAHQIMGSGDYNRAKERGEDFTGDEGTAANIAAGGINAGARIIGTVGSGGFLTAGQGTSGNLIRSSENPPTPPPPADEGVSPAMLVLGALGLFLLARGMK